MAEQFYSIVTKLGTAKIANSNVTGKKVNLTHLAVGDSNGSYYNPTEDLTSLKNEVWRGSINNFKVDEENPNWIIIEAVIPSSDGGFNIREAGIFDDEGTLIGVGKYPLSYKPVSSDGATKDLLVRMILVISNTSNIKVEVNPGIIIATKEDVQILQNDIKGLDGRITKNTSDIGVLASEMEDKANITDLKNFYLQLSGGTVTGPTIFNGNLTSNANTNVNTLITKGAFTQNTGYFNLGAYNTTQYGTGYMQMWYNANDKRLTMQSKDADSKLSGLVINNANGTIDTATINISATANLNGTTNTKNINITGAPLIKATKPVLNMQPDGFAAKSVITMIAKDNNGHSIAIDAGGTTIIGGGESASVFQKTLENAGEEHLYAIADTDVYIKTGYQTADTHKTWAFTSAGVLNTPGHINIGGALTVKATSVFTGNITSNGTTTTKNIVNNGTITTSGNATFNGTTATKNLNTNGNLAVTGTLKKGGRDVATGGMNITVSATAPSSPATNDIWIQT